MPKGSFGVKVSTRFAVPTGLPSVEAQQEASAGSDFRRNGFLNAFFLGNILGKRLGRPGKQRCPIVFVKRRR